jgi:diadenylate cyclase
MQIFQAMQDYINDLVDIAIISFIIYKLLTLLRGTRAVQLLNGIIIVILMWLISHFLNLNTLKWLIENLFSVGVIAIIVIFQPELRRALERLGRGGFFQLTRHVKDQMITQVANEISKVAVQLAKDRTGALIVVERQTGLSDFIQTGVRLEAQISMELLSNLFLPNGPLHDGAVIIRNDQVMAAGCYLPLSENPDISKQLGTRHRAGMGMSEISDAIVVVVSEETGGISLCVHGKMEHDFSEDELLSRLYREMKPAERRRSLFQRRKERSHE